MSIMEKCSWHKSSTLGYLQWHADAERRAAKGQKQRQCPDCLHWFWHGQFGTKPKNQLTNGK